MNFGIIVEWEAITFCIWFLIRRNVNIRKGRTFSKCRNCQIALKTIYYDSV